MRRGKVFSDPAELALAVVLALGMAGCATYQAKPLSAESGAVALEARTLTDAGLRAFLETNAPAMATEWPRSSWNLPALTLAAYYYQPEMNVARAKLAAAEAAIITAGARPNPAAGFSPTYDADAAAGVSPWTLGFTLDWPIETAGKRGYRLAQARYLANAARLDLARSAWLVRSRVHRSLLDLQAADLNQKIFSGQEAAQNRTVELLEERLQAGQSSRFELQLVRVAAAQTALQLRDVQTQAAQARVRLADALGVPVDALAGVALSFAGLDQWPDPQDAAALRREALLNRPDILGALAEYDASQSALQLEIARQYPDLHLGPGYAWDQGENKFTLGAALTLPVLNRNQGPIAEAEAHRAEAAAAFTALQARVIGEVDAAFAGYRDARRKLDTAQALVSDEQKRMQSMQDSFDAGASDRLELLQTQLEFQAGELARAAAFAEAQQALGALEDALERPVGADGALDRPAAWLGLKPD